MKSAVPVISAIIVDKSKLVREGLEIAFENLPHFRICGNTSDFEVARHLVKRHEPDIILLGGAYLGKGACSFLRSIKSINPDTRTLIINHGESEYLLISALEAGCRGYLKRSASVQNIIDAISGVYKGEFWVERKLFAKYLDHLKVSQLESKNRFETFSKQLTGREQEVFYFLSMGYTNRDISSKLYISEKTVKSHLNKIYKKLRVRNRLEAITSSIEQKSH